AHSRRLYRLTHAAERSSSAGFAPTARWRAPTRRTPAGGGGWPDEHVAHTRALEPDAADLVEAVATRDGRPGRGGGVVHEDHGDAGGRADPHPERLVGFHLAQRRHRETHGAAGRRRV